MPISSLVCIYNTQAIGINLETWKIFGKDMDDSSRLLVGQCLRLTKNVVSANYFDVFRFVIKIYIM